MSGLLIAAPFSCAGKTTVTLGLLRALRRRGIAVAAGKTGPDHLDPTLPAAASRTLCLNFDPW
ncbi:cobyrinic acid a,c-diamide synthase, partial [Rhizobium ruizarguesonis]